MGVHGHVRKTGRRGAQRCVHACKVTVRRPPWRGDWQVVQFVKDERYARFSRIIFDTAPTGHTLRFLSVPEFVNASLAKIVRLRRRLSSASSAIRGLFGASEQQDAAVAKLEALQVSWGEARPKHTHVAWDSG
jgi:anion-transporting  ArsA/GET3 family ATPase